MTHMDRADGVTRATRGIRMSGATTTPFVNTRTALCVSYGMSVRPVQVPCSLQQALISMMQTRKLTNARQREWYARLTGTPSRTVCFTGLSPMERAAQCALVRLAVVKHLERSQACAILLAYALASADRESGTLGVLDYLMRTTTLASYSPAVVRALIERRYARRATHAWHSLRAISERVSVSKSHLARIAQQVDRECSALEAQAMAELERHFVAQGVCPNPVIDLR